MEKLREIPEVLEFTIIVKLNTLYKLRDNKQIYNGHYQVQRLRNFLVLLKSLLLH